MGVVWHEHGKAGWVGWVDGLDGWMGWMVWDGMKRRYVHGCVLGRLFADGEIWRHRQTEHPNNTSFFFFLTLRVLLVNIQSSHFRVSKQAGKAKQAIKEVMVMMDDG